MAAPEPPRTPHRKPDRTPLNRAKKAMNYLLLAIRAGRQPLQLSPEQRTLLNSAADLLAELQAAKAE